MAVSTIPAPTKSVVLFSQAGGLAIGSDTTITLSEDYNRYQFLSFNFQFGTTTSTRTSTYVLTRMLALQSWYPVCASSSAVGVIRIGVPSGSPTGQIRIFSTSVSGLLLMSVTGII